MSLQVNNGSKGESEGRRIQKLNAFHVFLKKIFVCSILITIIIGYMKLTRIVIHSFIYFLLIT